MNKKLTAELSLKLIHNLLKYIIESGEILFMEEGYEEIFIDINSVFSTMHYEGVIDDPHMSSGEYIGKLAGMIKGALIGNANKHIKLFWYDVTENDRYFRTIIPEFKTEYLMSKNTVSYRPFVYFINTLKSICDGAGDNLQLIDCKKYEPSLCMYIYSRLNKRKTLVVSRDRMSSLLLTMNHIRLWDGLFLYSKDNFMYSTTKKFPKINPEYLKYYYMIRGEANYGYYGVHRYGEQKTIKYINENYKTLLDRSDKMFIDCEMIKMVGDESGNIIVKYNNIFDYEDIYNNMKSDILFEVFNIGVD